MIKLLLHTYKPKDRKKKQDYYKVLTQVQFA
jgi:hypothetical protein